ncbi:MAG: B12-binding domain-containing radical SAM protein [Candidatus Aminicenantia bacterium]
MVDVILVKLEPENETQGLPPPFGILYLADSLEKAGVKVKLFHKPASKTTIHKLIEDVSKEKPLFVGFSNFTTSPLNLAKKASIEIKKKFNIPIVWGGIHSTIFPEQTLMNNFIDIIVIGEGEETIVELTNLLSKKVLHPKDLADIQGIGLKNKGRIIINELRPFIKNLDTYSPAWHLLDIEKYIYTKQHFYTQIGSKISGEKIAAIITSRGCPWRCGYCYNQAVNKRNFRAQSVQKVIKEVQYLKKFDVSALIFEDDNFFASKNRALEIIRNINTSWSCSIRADYIAKWGDSFVKELSENGCFELRIGAESGSQRILDLMKKDITVEQIKKAVELCSQYKIRTLLNFMVGIPGESWSDVCKTLDFIDELEKIGKYVTISSVAIYAPWPGAFLSELAIKKGFRPPTSLEGWSKYWAQRVKLAPYSDKRIKFIGFYRVLIRKDFKNVSFPVMAKLLRRIALFRWNRRYFKFPLDYYIPAFFLRLLRKVGLTKISRALYE